MCGLLVATQGSVVNIVVTLGVQQEAGNNTSGGTNLTDTFSQIRAVQTTRWRIPVIGPLGDEAWKCDTAFFQQWIEPIGSHYGHYSRSPAWTSLYCTPGRSALPQCGRQSIDAPSRVYQGATHAHPLAHAPQTASCAPRAQRAHGTAIAFAFALAARKRAASPPRTTVPRALAGGAARVARFSRALRHWLARRRAKGTPPAAAALLAAVAALASLVLLLHTARVPPLAPPAHFAASATIVGPALLRVADLQHTLTESERELAVDFSLPPVVARALPPYAARALVAKLRYARHVAPLVPPRLLVIHVQNGLGNRLRALASGLAMARKSRRVPLIVWEADAHLGALFTDVLDPRSPRPVSSRNAATELYGDLVVVDSFPSWSSVQTQAHWRAFNYMVKDGAAARQGETLFFEPAQVACARAWWFGKLCVKYADAIERESHVYFKSAYVASAFPQSYSASSRVNAEMRALRPVKAVLDTVRAHWPRGVRYMFGAHVRSRLIARDGVALDERCEYSARAEETTDYWRSQSQLSEFVNLMSYLLRRYPQLHFFVAADDVAVLEKTRLAFPGRVHSISRKCDDRSPACVRFAFADMLALARCGRLYGSNWSSFTEAAGRLANRRPWLSGIHFGKRHGRPHHPLSISRILHAWRARIARRSVHCPPPVR